MSRTERRRRQHGARIATVRVFNQQSQQSRQAFQSAYGNMPFTQAGGLTRGFTNPLSAAFGIRPTFGQGEKGQRREARYERQMSAIEADQGPLGSYIRQAQQFLPSVMGQAQAAGAHVASLAPQLFDQLRGQVGSSLNELPGMMDTARGGVGRATEAVNQAFDPIAQQALYQNALRGSLEGMAPQAAARGLGDAGSQMAREETIGRDLAAQYAQQQFGNQQAALAGQQGALGTQAGLLPMGAQLTGMLQQALPGLQEAMAAGYQMPMDALNAVFQQIAAAQNPQLALLQTTTPQALTYSSGHGYGGILGG